MVSYTLLGSSTPFECTLTPFVLKNIPYYIILGLFCGACSIYFIRTTLKLEDRIGKMENVYLKWIMCAVGLGILIFLFPPLYGEGYESLGVLLNGKELSLDGQTPLAFLAHSPWSVPIFFMLIPLILTSTIAFGTTRIVEKYSIYTKRIAQRGELLTHDSDQAVLTLLKVSDVIETDFSTVKIDDTLGRLVEVVSESTRNIFPVLDSVDRFQGFVSLEDIRKDMFRTDEYETLHVFNFMRSAEEYVYEDEKMDSVMKKFEVTSAWNLPVVRRDRTYVGFVSKSKIFSAYRDELKVVSQD